MTVEYELTSDDVRKYSAYLAMESRPGRRSLALARALFIAVLLGLTALGPLTSPPRSILSLVVYLVVVGVIVFLVGWQAPLLGRRFVAEQSAAVMIRQSDPLGRWKLVVTREGIDFSHAKGSGRIAWSAVQRVETHDGSVYLFLGPTTAHIVPASAFHGQAGTEEFVALSSDEASRAHDGH